MLRVNESLCTGCNLCSLSCSLHFFKVAGPARGRIRIDKKTHTEHRVRVCAECGICRDVCPEGAIQPAGKYLKINPDLCNGCGECIAECPEEALFIHPHLHYPLKCTHCGICARFCYHGAITNGDD